jgi:HEAT repeat protein
MTSRELKRGALAGIARNDNRDGAATYLIRVFANEKELELRKSALASLGRVPGDKSLAALTNTVESDPDVEMQKQAVRAIGRRNRDEAIPVLIRIGRNHPKMPVRKQAIQALGQTGDERAVALFTELLANERLVHSSLICVGNDQSKVLVLVQFGFHCSGFSPVTSI